MQILPDVASALGLVLHELATNAAKYGALSLPDGGVSIRWTAEEGHVRIRWTEHGGPPVSPPARRGFGTTLIESSLSHALGGEIALTYDPAGLRAEMASGPSLRWLRGARVLVLEDEALIALDLEAMLLDAGWSVMGPAGTLDRARALLARRAPMLACLDLNLGRETSHDLARDLLAQGVPVVFVSGRDARALPEDLRRCRSSASRSARRSCCASWPNGLP
jgi:CheY-like chemotaxis protein